MRFHLPPVDARTGSAVLIDAQAFLALAPDRRLDEAACVRTRALLVDGREIVLAGDPSAVAAAITAADASQTFTARTPIGAPWGALAPETPGGALSVLVSDDATAQHRDPIDGTAAEIVSIGRSASLTVTA